MLSPPLAEMQALRLFWKLSAMVVSSATIPGLLPSALTSPQMHAVKSRPSRPIMSFDHVVDGLQGHSLDVGTHFCRLFCLMQKITAKRSSFDI